MENEEIKTKEEKRDLLSAIFLLQGLFVAVMLISLYIIKMFIPSLFSPVKDWIKNRFYQNTSVEQIFDNSEYSDFTENDYSVY